MSRAIKGGSSWDVEVVEAVEGDFEAWRCLRTEDGRECGVALPSKELTRITAQTTSKAQQQHSYSSVK
jgi:hypothetical protein